MGKRRNSKQKKSPKNNEQQKDPEKEPIDIEAAAKAAGLDLNSMDTNQLLKDAANMMQSGQMPQMPGGSGGPSDDAPNKLNKQEKKARKTIQKLGMKLQKGFTRVTIKKSKNILFGNAKIEDMNQSHREFLSDKWAPKPDASQMPAIQEDQEDDEDVDTTGLDENDIQMVVEQASVSRSKAVKALRNHDGDIVNAIMELTM